MAYIISKRDGPHREELKAKDFLQKNRTKINSLANHLTLGRWQELRNPTPPTEPPPSGLWRHARMGSSSRLTTNCTRS